MRLSDLGGQRLLVLGVGIDVAALLPTVLASRPAALVVVDEDPARAAAALAALGAGDVPVLDSVAAAPDADVAIRSPGFSPYRPAIRERLDRGMASVTPLGLWLCERDDRPSVAITGTKGKSSTSVLTRIALEQLGVHAVVLGNIGVPPWSCTPATAETAVLEISSYQAVDLPLTPSVAALTAIGEDHVGWHGSVARYLADKARIFRAPTPNGERWCGVPEHVELPAEFAGIAFTRIAAPADLRRSNAAVAAAVALAATGGDAGRAGDLADELLDRYPDLPGRFATVSSLAGVDFIDDALASNPLGLAAALRSLAGRAVVAIVGGADRRAALDPVLAAIRERTEPTLVICIDDAAVLADRYRSAGAVVEPSTDLEAAVELAAGRITAGGAVLFSPGMPTPPAQGSWVERSERFRRAVERLRSRA